MATAITYWSYVEPVVSYLRSQDGSFYAEWKHFNDRHGERITTAAREHLDSYAHDDAVTAASTATSAATTTGAGNDGTAGAQLTPIAGEVPPAGEEIHLPEPSILPLLSAVAITLILIGLTTTLLLSLAGGTLLVWTSARWIKDVRTDMDHLPWDHLPR
jgi:hypothetical protein